MTHRPSHVQPRTARSTVETAGLAAAASLLLALLFTASTFATAAAQATEEPELTWAPLVTLRPIAEPPFLTPSELEDGYSLGAPDAPVAIEVWEDFQCPYCQRFAFEVKPAIVARFVETGQARLTFRNLAFLGDESHWAAVAASLAAEQDRFWPFHDYLFGNLLGENVGSYSLERLLAIGEASGLDMGRFREGLVARGRARAFRRARRRVARRGSCPGYQLHPDGDGERRAARVARPRHGERCHRGRAGRGLDAVSSRGQRRAIDERSLVGGISWGLGRRPMTSGGAQMHREPAARRYDAAAGLTAEGTSIDRDATTDSRRQAPSTPPEAPSAPPVAVSSTKANVDRASAMTEDLLDRGAPWSSSTTWTIVMVEGIVAVVLGLIFIVQPLGGTSTVLQLVGVALLVGALLSAFQVWRQHIRPDLEVLAAFRSGSGVTVGLSVVVATFFTEVSDTVTAALAVIVGIGFFVFGLSGIAASFVRRKDDAPLPVVTLILNAVLAAAGVVLTFSGAGGSSAVDGIFVLLGVLLVIGGVGLAGYAYMLRQREMSGVRR